MAWKNLRLQFEGDCMKCSEYLKEGQSAWWNSSSKKILCKECYENPDRFLENELKNQDQTGSHIIDENTSFPIQDDPIEIPAVDL